MKNNFVLRNLRYIFNWGDDKMMSVFAKGGLETDRTELSNWLKREEDQDYQSMHDKHLSHFLNGVIIEFRGKKEGVEMPVEKQLTNNMVLRKLRIALNYKDTDMLAILQSVDLKFSKHELSAFFRRPDHQHYREAKDQIVRNFLMGLKNKYRPSPGIREGR